MSQSSAKKIASVSMLKPSLSLVIMASPHGLKHHAPVAGKGLPFFIPTAPTATMSRGGSRTAQTYAHHESKAIDWRRPGNQSGHAVHFELPQPITAHWYGGASLQGPLLKH